jgi:4-diphosphocytidyl-2-C-methyl-D-erythritol kinase
MPDEEPTRLAPVKVNLTLHIGARRPDGYHQVDTLCLFPAFGDAVSLGPHAKDFSLGVEGPFADELAGVDPERNLVLRAARLMAREAGARPMWLRLVKRVPAASGVAGGTADAAAAMVLLNETLDRLCTPTELIRLAQALGADGPVCVAGALFGGVWRARGIGERVERVSGPPPLWMVLSNPRAAVPTGRVFAGLRGGERPLPQAELSLRTVSQLVRAGLKGRNDLRAPAAALAPGIAATEASLSRAPGCLFARMSGSGATVFGLFASAAAADRAARREQAAGRWAVSAPLLRRAAGAVRGGA